MAVVKSKFRSLGYWFAGILAVALAFLQALPVWGKSRTESNVTSTGSQSTTNETDVLIATMLNESAFSNEAISSLTLPAETAQTTDSKKLSTTPKQAMIKTDKQPQQAAKIKTTGQKTQPQQAMKIKTTGQPQQAMKIKTANQPKQAMIIDPQPRSSTKTGQPQQAMKIKTTGQPQQAMKIKPTGQPQQAMKIKTGVDQKTQPQQAMKIKTGDKKVN